MSILLAAMMFGNLLSFPLADRLGRRRTLSLASSLVTLGWTVMLAAPDLRALLLARTVVGVGVGVSDPASYLLLSEMSLVR